jgi:hypothetical protein
MSDQSDQDIGALQEQLRMHRRRLGLLLTQRAKFGWLFAPTHISIDIEDTRAEIQRIKTSLRAAGVVVADELNDVASPSWQLSRVLRSSLVRWALGIGLIVAVVLLALRLAGGSPQGSGSPTQTSVTAMPVRTAQLPPATQAPLQASATVPTTDQPTPGSSCPSTISFGERLLCNLSAGAATVTFDSEAGDDIYVVVTRLPPGDLGPVFTVFQPDSAPTDCAAKDALVAGATCTLSGAGTHSIRIERGDDELRGVYAVYLQRLNNPGLATAVAGPEPIIGAISTTDEYDTYTISVDASAIAVISVDPLDSGLGPGLQVYDPRDGTQVCDAESSARLDTTCILPQAGTYTMLIFDRRRGGAGRYELVVTTRLNSPG